MGRVIFQQIQQFHVDDPHELGRQFSQVEANVAAAFGRIDALFAQRLTPTALQTKAYTAKVGDLVVTDSSQGSVAIAFPAAHPQNAGLSIGVVRKSAANAVRVAPTSGLANGVASFATSAAVGLTSFVSDGSGWWGK